MMRERRKPLNSHLGVSEVSLDGSIVQLFPTQFFQSLKLLFGPCGWISLMISLGVIPNQFSSLKGRFIGLLRSRALRQDAGGIVPRLGKHLDFLGGWGRGC